MSSLLFIKFKSINEQPPPPPSCRQVDRNYIVEILVVILTVVGKNTTCQTPPTNKVDERYKDWIATKGGINKGKTIKYR